MVIYRIVNVKNSRVYIGSTVCFINRKSQHIKDLIEKKHHNFRLQKDFNKQGIDSFVFEILETGYRNKKDLFLREYELIARLKNSDYNIDRTLSLNHIGITTEEDRVTNGKTGTYIFVNKKKAQPTYNNNKNKSKHPQKKKKCDTKYVRPKETKKQRRIREGIIQIDGWDKKIQEYYNKKELRDSQK